MHIVETPTNIEEAENGRIFYLYAQFRKSDQQWDPTKRTHLKQRITYNYCTICLAMNEMQSLDIVRYFKNDNVHPELLKKICRERISHTVIIRRVGLKPHTNTVGINVQ